MSVAVLAPPHPVVACAAGVRAASTGVAHVQPVFMTTADKESALVELTRAEAQVAELKARILAASDDVATAHGAHDVAAWLAHATRTDSRSARAELHLATALDRHPAVAAGMRTGAVSAAQARVITTAIDDLPTDLGPAVAASAEETLIGYAAHTSTDTGGTGTSTGERVPQHRAYAYAFAALLELLDPDRLPEHGGDATTVMVTLSLAQLLTDLATAGVIAGDGEEAISATDARRLACQATIIPVVLGGQGEILAAWTEAHHLHPGPQVGPPTSPTRSASATTTITASTTTRSSPPPQRRPPLPPTHVGRRVCAGRVRAG